MSDIDQSIRQRVDHFVADLTELIRQAALESVSAALGTQPTSVRGRSSTARSGAASSKTSSPRGRGATFSAKKGARRTAGELEKQGATLISIVQKNPGIRADQIAKTLGVATRDLALPIKKLLEDKAISKKGQRRATAYYAK